MRNPTPLKRAIFERQLIQKDIAADLGVDPGHLSRIVNGGPCSDELARRIAAKIDVPVEDVFTACGHGWNSLPGLPEAA